MNWVIILIIILVVISITIYCAFYKNKEPMCPCKKKMKKIKKKCPTCGDISSEDHIH